MVFDQEGNLYGVTQIGGSDADGTTYRLSPPTQGGAWTETVLHTFKGVSGNDGAAPTAGLTWGKWNDLYGGATEGGLCGGLGCGTAFALQP